MWIPAWPRRPVAAQRKGLLTGEGQADTGQRAPWFWVSPGEARAGPWLVGAWPGDSAGGGGGPWLVCPGLSQEPRVCWKHVWHPRALGPASGSQTQTAPWEGWICQMAEPCAGAAGAQDGRVPHTTSQPAPSWTRVLPQPHDTLQPGPGLCWPGLAACGAVPRPAPRLRLLAAARGPVPAVGLAATGLTGLLPPTGPVPSPCHSCSSRAPCCCPPRALPAPAVGPPPFSPLSPSSVLPSPQEPQTTVIHNPVDGIKVQQSPPPTWGFREAGSRPRPPEGPECDPGKPLCPDPGRWEATPPAQHAAH